VTGKEETSPGNQSGTISASPNPCVIPVGGTTCATVLTWTTASNVLDARIAISDTGTGLGPYLFGRGKSGAITVDIEGPPHRYRFVLYQIAGNRLIELGAVEATASASAGLVGANELQPFQARRALARKSVSLAGEEGTAMTFVCS
jgi:hypothetical protein